MRNDLDAPSRALSEISATAAGTDTYTANLDPAITAYTSGAYYLITFTNANTAVAPTINLNSLGAKTIKLNGGGALIAGSLIAGHKSLLKYDGTDMILMNARQYLTPDESTVEFNAWGIRVKDLGIVEAKLGALSVTNGKLGTGSVTGDKLQVFLTGNYVVSKSGAKALSVSASYVKLWSARMPTSGTVKTKVTLTQTESTNNWTEDIAGWSVGDTIEIYGKTVEAGHHYARVYRNGSGVGTERTLAYVSSTGTAGLHIAAATPAAPICEDITYSA
jgi:hypothetical protein